jgi:hypothetical protein
MVTPNILIVALAALIPLVVGFIWYNQKVFGNVWLRVSGVDPNPEKKPNMALIFGLTYVLSFLIAMAMNFIVIHQMHVFSVMANEPGIMDAGSETNNYLLDFMSRYGDRFRTFKHGAFHGFIAGFMMAMPVLGINAMFERKGFKYIAINGLYWMVSMALMGGIICAFT